MDNWGTEETPKKDSDIARKIIIAMMILLIIVIMAVVYLLLTVKTSTFKITIDGKNASTTKEKLLRTVDGTTYFNIQELASLLKNDYHIGEYKVYSSDTDKCYIQSKEETASFYLNSTKICKLKVNKLTDDYDVFNSENPVIEKDTVFYAPIDAIKIGFNIKVTESESGINITTLDQLAANIEASINPETTADTTKEKYNIDKTFDNEKAMLYDYVVLSKSSSNLYGVITTSGKEILPDKYTSITFLETTKEFLVKNNSGKMGIIDSNGQNKVEQAYDSIKVINNSPKLYLVQTNQKYGVLDENGKTVVYPEYDSIGADATKYKKLQNQYVLLNKVIPVCKDKKYGLFDVASKKVLDVSYEGIVCELVSAEIDGVNKEINPAIAIEDCRAVVIKNNNDSGYSLFFVDEEKLTPLRVSAIYYLTSEGKDTYYMAYKGKQLDLIERLIEEGVIKRETVEENLKNENTTDLNNTTNNEINNTTTEQNSVNTLSTSTNLTQTNKPVNVNQVD